MLDEGRILDTLGVEMDVDLYTQTPAAAAGEMARLGVWSGPRPSFPGLQTSFPTSGRGDNSASGAEFVLASWRMNLDGGRGLDGEPHLMGTARPDVVRLSPEDAARLGVRSGDAVTIRGPLSSITLPLIITGMVNGVVWLPAHIDGVATAGRLGAGASDVVRVVPRPGDGPGFDRSPDQPSPDQPSPDQPSPDQPA